MGGTTDLLYERTNLINSYPDIILVTINYRIGILVYIINLSILENGDK